MSKDAVYGDVTSKAVGTTSSLVVDADPKRKTLILFPPANTQVTLHDNTPVVLGQGINLNQAAGPTVLRRSEVGPLVASSFFGIAGVSTFIGIVEGSGDE